MSNDLATSIATTLRSARLRQGLSAAALAERADVSRAMIGKIERGEAQPTAVLLGRISGALGMTLSELLARAEGNGSRLARREQQPIWIDPETGYQRRAVSPGGGRPLELVEVILPGRAEISYPADAYAFVHQQIWLLEGRLRFREGNTDHDLEPGDLLQLGPPAACTFINPADQQCRYLVALTRRES